MRFYPEHLYHIYNRGNDRQPIFFSPANYRYFLGKMRRHLLSHGRLLAYCLMPNHFHWLVYTRPQLREQALNQAIGVLLRSYARAVNQQEDRTGSLFRQKTQARALSYRQAADGTIQPDVDPVYAATCFHYIHQNPLRARLVDRLEAWPYASFLDYAGLRDGTLCDQRLARSLLDLPAEPEAFRALSHQMVDPARIKR